MINITYNTRLTLFISIILLLIPSPTSAQERLKDLLFIDQSILDKNRDEYSNKKSSLKSPLKKYLKQADEFLKTEPLTITDKETAPPSGDKRDFISMSPYWWPDPSKPDGLPYIRRDGERNPDYYKYKDQEYFGQVAERLQVLSNAYYITQDNKYAFKAAEIIRVFFLNENTRMNPNLKFAQFIPGRSEGRGNGMIETRLIYRITDAVVLLRTSDAWNKTENALTVKWFEEFYEWINTHQYGKDESNAKNNHGTWYDVQRNSIALFLGKSEEAKEALETAKRKRIDKQILPDGSQPLELERTRSWNYSVMNLSAMMHIAVLAEKAGVDLWNYQSPDGGSIRKALDYLLPYAAGDEDWKHTQIVQMSNDDLVPLLMMAQKKYDEDIYGSWMKKIFGPEPKMPFLGRIL